MIFLMIDNRHNAANLTKSVFFSVSPLVCIKPEQEDRFIITTFVIFIIIIFVIFVFIFAIFFSTVLLHHYNRRFISDALLYEGIWEEGIVTNVIKAAKLYEVKPHHPLSPSPS